MSYRAYSLRADLNQTLGNHNEALFDYTRVLKYLPTHVPTLTSQASVHKRMGDYEKAKAQFEFILTFEGMVRYISTPTPTNHTSRPLWIQFSSFLTSPCGFSRCDALF